MNILLVGPRGSGKSTLGRLLADRLHHSFVDLDDTVLATFEQTCVTDVWAMHGEHAWRRSEVQALLRTFAARDQVIALGGGTPMVPDAFEYISRAISEQAAVCIYLHCHPDQLAHRLSVDAGDRPSLTGDDPARESAVILAQREPTYRKLANIVIDVSDHSIAESCEVAVEQLRRFGLG